MTTQKQPHLLRRLLKLQNPFMSRLLRSSRHGMVSDRYMLLTFTGRKTGRIFTTPITYQRVDDRVFVVTSENFGWWKNLRGGAEVEVFIRHQSYRGLATASRDPERIAEARDAVYPRLSEKQKRDFIPGKVAVEIRLQDVRV